MLCIHCYKVTLKGVNAQNILPFFAYCNLRLGREDVWQQINILLLFGLFVTESHLLGDRIVCHVSYRPQSIVAEFHLCFLRRIAFKEESIALALQEGGFWHAKGWVLQRKRACFVTPLRLYP
jgi:hypothetical protein